MVHNRVLNNQWALVTGASSGIGKEFAYQLANLGCSLIITARRKERLEVIAAELEEKYSVSVAIETMDLAQPDAPAQLKARLETRELKVDILVNNAGFGLQSDFVDLEWKDWKSVIALDIEAFTQMSHVFACDMKKRNIQGKIIQVGSIFSFGGVPTYAVYSGAKAYVLSFSEALAEELRPYGITVTMLAPGVTQTEFFNTASEGKVSDTGKKIMQSPAEVVNDGIEAMLAKKPLVVSGWINKVMVFSRRLRTRQNAVRWLGKASQI